MPLVILCGWPLVGKTSFAEKLKEEVSSYFEDILVVNEEYLGIDGTKAIDVGTEKKNRGAFLAAVERNVSSNRLVIADGCNEIKGFRYQLYCIARAASTPHCCIHLLGKEETIYERNTEYNMDAVKDTISRFEEPNSQARWDSPLFHVGPDGEFSQMEELIAALKGGAMKQPSLATRKSDLPLDYVQALESECRRVLERVQSMMSVNQLSGVIDGHSIQLTRRLTVPELQRLKRQFIQMNRQTNCPTKDICRLFIDYLSKYSD